ncbi:probable protein phosphatase 2C 27 [Tanacetum coccineum]
MNPQETEQVIARDELWVPTAERVNISTTNVRLETTVKQKEETFLFHFNYNDGEERSQNSGQLDVGKQPRNLVVVRHSISTATLLTPTDLAFDLGIVGMKSASDGKSEYTPMIRSGSCAEKWPKETCGRLAAGH